MFGSALDEVKKDLNLVAQMELEYRSDWEGVIYSSGNQCLLSISD